MERKERKAFDFRKPRIHFHRHPEPLKPAEQRDFPDGDRGDCEQLLFLQRRSDRSRGFRRNAFGISHPPDQGMRVQKDHGGSSSQSSSATDAVGSMYSTSVPRSAASVASGSSSNGVSLSTGIPRS